MSKRLIPHHHAATTTSFASIAVIAECIITKERERERESSSSNTFY